MKQKLSFGVGIFLLGAFAGWTFLIQCMDVQAVGPDGTMVGFAAFNVRFHQLTGVHMSLYVITDWLGLVPILICLCFAGVGLVQWIKRRHLFKVDADILLLGVYYLLVIFGYLFFEMVPINYRPILIDGNLEASYPSSTTLLVLSVMPSLSFQINRRIHHRGTRILTNGSSVTFTVCMVLGRLTAGVHWATDIIGSVLLSTGLFLLYQSAVWLIDGRNE